MREKVRWGVLGVSTFAMEKCVPAMQLGKLSEVIAIASRKLQKAQAAADELGLKEAYGSYEELLANSNIDAIYNPLPNHLHVSWTARAAEAGKHVLCEKPLALSRNEATKLLKIRAKTGVKIGEAFMVKTHPQWLEARELVRSGKLGKLRAIQGAFSYFNTDPKDVRNIAEYGGGGVLDIGCYPITTSRFILGKEPRRVLGTLEFDPDFKIDRLASVILDFGDLHSSFICSTQMVPFQRMHFFGTERRLEIEIPFNAPPDRPCRLFIDEGDLFGRKIETFELPTVDQYTVQGDAFSEAILKDEEPPVPLEDSINNMAVIDAVFRSGKSGRWETPDTI